jgi:acyl transferase domain-containing protein
LYYRPAHQHLDGKLAFVLPGLGAAYPNMLRELSMHFPQVRIIFDYVDFISGEQTAPSNYIFPNSNNADSALSSAMLASMDSAVVTVLLAEWALFLLLQKLHIRPDQMVGCSTGEFGALTMGGAVDVVSTAPMFYRASTRVARSVPKEQIAQLTSMKVDAGCEQIEALIKRLDAPVYLTADLSPSHTIITGDRKTMRAAAALLEQNQISSHMLPVAIPYHTPLVKDKVTGNDPEIKELPISPPEIKAWSCSTGQPYPQDVEELRRILTALFEKPIRLRTTIDKMYDDGVRAFVELGPRGALTPLIQETLGNREHLAIAADLVNRGGISQLHHLIAALFCYGFSMDLDYLYARRAPQLVTFPNPVYEPQCDPVPHYSEEGTVVANYLNTLATFHKQMLDSQQQVMLRYLVTAGSLLKTLKADPRSLGAQACCLPHLPAP